MKHLIKATIISLLPSKILKCLVENNFFRKLASRVGLLNAPYILKEKFNNEESLKKYLIKTNEIKKLILRNNEHVKEEIAANKDFYDEFKNNTKIAYSERENFLCHCLTLYNKKEIKCLDIGGGFKPCHFTLQHSLPNKKIETIVVEPFENVLKGANSIYGKIKNLKYQKDIPTKESFDVIYFGSSIQYFLDLKNLLQKLPTSKLIVISYSQFVENGETFISAQYTAGKKYLVPCIVHNTKDFLDLFKSYDYELIHKSPSGQWNYGFNYTYRIYNLVFLNKNQNLSRMCY